MKSLNKVYAEISYTVNNEKFCSIILDEDDAMKNETSLLIALKKMIILESDFKVEYK